MSALMCGPRTKINVLRQDKISSDPQSYLWWGEYNQLNIMTTAVSIPNWFSKTAPRYLNTFSKYPTHSGIFNSILKQLYRTQPARWDERARWAVMCDGCLAGKRQSRGNGGKVTEEWTRRRTRSDSVCSTATSERPSWVYVDPLPFSVGPGFVESLLLVAESMKYVS